MREWRIIIIGNVLSHFSNIYITNVPGGVAFEKLLWGCDRRKQTTRKTIPLSKILTTVLIKRLGT